MAENNSENVDVDPRLQHTTRTSGTVTCLPVAAVVLYCIVLIALSRCNRVFTHRLRLCHSHTVHRREVRKGDREGPK